MDSQYLHTCEDVMHAPECSCNSKLDSQEHAIDKPVKSVCRDQYWLTACQNTVIAGVCCLDGNILYCTICISSDAILFIV